MYFHGGNTGSNPVGDANRSKLAASLRFQIFKPKRFLVCGINHKAHLLTLRGRGSRGCAEGRVSTPRGCG
jgi:hypothetical protein